MAQLFLCEPYWLAAMRWPRLTTRLRAVFARGSLERQMEEELRLHIELQTEENLRLGLSPEEATRQARIAFGGVERVKEECRDFWGVRLVETLLQDLRLGARNLRAAPGFTAVVVLTLALGIGANSALFSVVNAVLLRPLPYPEDHRLVLLTQRMPGFGEQNTGFSVPELQDYRSRTDSFEALVEYHSMRFTLLGGAQPERVSAGVVSGDFFDVLGIQPLLGRTFRPGEDQPGAEPTLILSYDYWMRSQRADPQIVGRTYALNDRAHTVVGVLPAIPSIPTQTTSICRRPHVRSARGAA